MTEYIINRIEELGGLETDYTAKKYKVGAKFDTKQGYKIKILGRVGGKRLHSNNLYLVKFLGENECLRIMSKQVIKDRAGKNPHHRQVCGIGYVGCGEYNIGENKGVYMKWINTIRDHSSNGTVVSEDWYNFQNYAKEVLCTKG